MARLLDFAACLAFAGSVASIGVARVGVARADNKTSKVTIETDPPGAKVYFNLKEDGEKCKTPCTIDAPVGETPIIVEAENRRPIIENLVVPKKSARPIKVVYKLEPAVGTLVVEGGAGATIKVDDEDKGKAPARVEGVFAGAHHVVVEQNGKPLFDQFVEVEDGHEAMVTAAAGTGGAPTPSSGDASPAVRATAPTPAPRARHGPAIALSGVMDVGFRHFTYANNLTRDTQRNDTENGQVLAGPIVELWPTTLAGLDLLPGLALYGRFEYGLNAQAVTIVKTTGAKMPTTLSTAWRSLEVSLHQRWTIAGTGTIEVGGGYVQDQYQFKGDATDIANVPDAVYKTVRIGGRASLLLGLLEPYVVAENRVVLSGGAMDARYSLGASTSGVHAAIGAALHLSGHLEAHLEGALTRYSWTFKFDNTDMHRADGGTDSIENVTIAIGYLY
ncbi:MAG TPA: PEGA domain-containing protein [Kofleriaceae bacterium]|nr:PEGA domain-containing protein [Kofleriaceae bacterium]